MLCLQGGIELSSFPYLTILVIDPAELQGHNIHGNRVRYIEELDPYKVAKAIPFEKGPRQAIEAAQVNQRYI
jgi:hypothetical protein